MSKPFAPCLPTRGTFVPHEVKYDGFRLLVHREGDRVSLITRGGHDWTKRYPWIVEAALKNRHKQFVLDGEAVVLGINGISDFNALHSSKHNHEVQLYAFDVLAMDGDDLRDLPLSIRKPVSPSCWRASRTGYSSAALSRVRSVPSCFATPA
jgi:bifunctional non-homologous end joining protein LigD